MSDFYGSDLAAIHADGFEGLARAAALRLSRHLERGPEPGTVLDLGCGAGALSLALHAEGFATWGLDVSEAMIAIALSRMPRGNFVCGSLTDTPYPEAMAAAAIGEVLNYVTYANSGTLGRIFRRVRQALPAGGVFLFDVAGPGRAGCGRGFTASEHWATGVLSTEHDGWLERRITTFRHVEGNAWRRSDETHYLQLWTPEQVEEAAYEAGFRVCRLVDYDGIVLPPALHVFLATAMP